MQMRTFTVHIPRKRFIKKQLRYFKPRKIYIVLKIEDFHNIPRKGLTKSKCITA